MIRFLMIFLLLVHGLIHFLGFAKAFRLAEIPQLTQPITKPTGALWLLSGVLFLITTGYFLLQKNNWWLWAVPALIVSQALIINAWQDAKWGTLANALIAVGIVLGWANWNFAKLAQQQREALLSAGDTTATLVTEAQLANLPPVIAQWLRRSQVVGKERSHSIYLRQRGLMRTAPNSKWIPFEAEQYFTTDPPGFVWTAHVQIMPFVYMKGIDTYAHSKGHMLIKVLALAPVVDAKGPAIDQGTMLRYLGEICWFPTTALSDYITWEALDAHSAKATMRYGDVTASGLFTFDAAGDMQSFEAPRYYDRKTGPTLEQWHIQNTATAELSGIRMPVQSEVTWKLQEGDFTWLKLEITEVAYNQNLIKVN
ncbi:MAG TPA: hypothetical protein PKD70_08475 [Saprospiraceae bacterium]|nr:hypothetical protein [Saprospiraceae bacterium]